MNEPDLEIAPAKLLAIIQQEQPMVYELAVRRAIIEQQREIIARLHAASVDSQLSTNGHAGVPS